MFYIDLRLILLLVFNFTFIQIFMHMTVLHPVFQLIVYLWNNIQLLLLLVVVVVVVVVAAVVVIAAVVVVVVVVLPVPF